MPILYSCVARSRLAAWLVLCSDDISNVSDALLFRKADQPGFAPPLFRPIYALVIIIVIISNVINTTFDILLMYLLVN